MGLAEQKLAGAVQERVSREWTVTPAGSGSVSFGSAYAILAIQTDTPTRLRLYENEASRDDVTEIARSFGDANIQDNIALIGDFSMSLAGVNNTADPVLYAVTHTGSLTHYRTTPVAPSARITITSFTLEDENIVPGADPAYTLNNRRNLPELTATVSSTGYASGSVDAPEVPRTYLLVSASLSGSDNVGRIRLYSIDSPLTDPAEVSRSFEDEPAADSYLIADVVISGSETLYFTPKIIGANLDTMGTDLSVLAGDRVLIDGQSEIHYILENQTGTTSEISASFNIFSLED